MHFDSKLLFFLFFLLGEQHLAFSAPTFGYIAITPTHSEPNGPSEYFNLFTLINTSDPSFGYQDEIGDEIRKTATGWEFYDKNEDRVVVAVNTAELEPPAGGWKTATGIFEVTAIPGNPVMFCNIGFSRGSIQFDIMNPSSVVVCSAAPHYHEFGEPYILHLPSGCNVRGPHQVRFRITPNDGGSTIEATTSLMDITSDHTVASTPEYEMYPGKPDLTSSQLRLQIGDTYEHEFVGVFSIEHYAVRTESVYTKADLLAAGIRPGDQLNSLFLKLAEVHGQEMADFQIRIAFIEGERVLSGFAPEVQVRGGSDNEDIVCCQDTLVYLRTVDFTTGDSEKGDWLKFDFEADSVPKVVVVPNENQFSAMVVDIYHTVQEKQATGGLYYVDTGSAEPRTVTAYDYAESTWPDGFPQVLYCDSSSFAFSSYVMNMKLGKVASPMTTCRDEKPFRLDPVPPAYIVSVRGTDYPLLPTLSGTGELRYEKPGTENPLLRLEKVFGNFYTGNIDSWQLQIGPYRTARLSALCEKSSKCTFSAEMHKPTDTLIQHVVPGTITNVVISSPAAANSLIPLDSTVRLTYDIYFKSHVDMHVTLFALSFRDNAEFPVAEIGTLPSMDISCAPNCSDMFVSKAVEFTLVEQYVSQWQSHDLFCADFYFKIDASLAYPDEILDVWQDVNYPFLVVNSPSFRLRVVPSMNLSLSIEDLIVAGAPFEGALNGNCVPDQSARLDLIVCDEPNVVVAPLISSVDVYVTDLTAYQFRLYLPRNVNSSYTYCVKATSIQEPTVVAFSHSFRIYTQAPSLVTDVEFRAHDPYINVAYPFKPLYTFYLESKSQNIYLASELSSMGLVRGSPIYAVSFIVHECLKTTADMTLFFSWIDQDSVPLTGYWLERGIPEWSLLLKIPPVPECYEGYQIEFNFRDNLINAPPRWDGEKNILLQVVTKVERFKKRGGVYYKAVETFRSLGQASDRFASSKQSAQRGVPAIIIKTGCQGASPCSNHGTCNAKEQCECEPGYLGLNCQHHCSAESTCNRGGFCDISQLGLGRQNDAVCQCYEGRFGDTCLGQGIYPFSNNMMRLVYNANSLGCVDPLFGKAHYGSSKIVVSVVRAKYLRESGLQNGTILNTMLLEFAEPQNAYGNITSLKVSIQLTENTNFIDEIFDKYQLTDLKADFVDAILSDPSSYNFTRMLDVPHFATKTDRRIVRSISHQSYIHCSTREQIKWQGHEDIVVVVSSQFAPDTNVNGDYHGRLYFAYTDTYDTISAWTKNVTYTLSSNKQPMTDLPPVIANVSVGVGAEAGNDTITITGTGFGAGTDELKGVYILTHNNMFIPCQSSIWVSETTVLCLTPDMQEYRQDCLSGVQFVVHTTVSGLADSVYRAEPFFFHYKCEEGLYNPGDFTCKLCPVGSTTLTWYSSDCVCQSGARVGKAPPCPEGNDITGASFSATLFAIGAVCVFVLGTGVLVYINRRSRVIHSASPPFCFLILFGLLLSIASGFVSVLPQTSALCTARMWLFCLGFQCTFGSLIVKTYRLHIIFNTQQLNIKKITNMQLFSYLICFGILPDCAILLAWTIKAPFTVDDPDAKVCTSADFAAFFWALVALKIAVIVFGSYLTWKVRLVPSVFNESKYIAYTIYNMILIGFAYLVSMLINISTRNTTIVHLVLMLLMCVSVDSLIFVPKLFWVATDRDARFFRKLRAGVQISYGHGSRYTKHSGQSSGSLSEQSDQEPTIGSLKGQAQNLDAQVEKGREEVTKRTMKYNRIVEDLAKCKEEVTNATALLSRVMAERDYAQHMLRHHSGGKNVTQRLSKSIEMNAMEAKSPPSIASIMQGSSRSDSGSRSRLPSGRFS